MSLKDVWTDGRREWRRRRSIRRNQGNLKNQETALNEQITELGAQAWNIHLDTSPWPDLERGLHSRQLEWDQITRDQEGNQRELAEAEKHLQAETEASRQEVSAMDARLKTAREAMDEVRRRLNAREQERDRVQARCGHLTREIERLNSELNTPDLTEEKRAGILRNQEQLNAEQAGLLEERQKLTLSCEEEQTALEPRREAVQKLEQEKDLLQSRHRDTLGQAQARLKDLKSQAEHLLRSLKATEEARRTLFHDWGQKLMLEGTVPAGLEGPWQVIENTRAQMKNTRLDLQQLEHQATPQANRAYRLMLLLLGGGVLILLALAVLVIHLLRPAKPSHPLEGVAQVVHGKDAGEMVQAWKNLADTALKNAQDKVASTEGVPDAHSSLPGVHVPDTPVEDTLPGSSSPKRTSGPEPASREALLGLMKWNRTDWTLSEPVYQTVLLPGGRTASLRTTARKGQGQPVSVEVTDTGGLSVMLEPVMTLLSMPDTGAHDAVLRHATSLQGPEGSLIGPMVETLEHSSGTARIVLVLHKRYLLNLETRDAAGLPLLHEVLNAMPLVSFNP